jgi:hypothetical protein
MSKIKDHFFNDIAPSPFDEPQPCPIDMHMSSLAFKLNLAITDPTAIDLITDDEVEILRMIVADNKEEINYDF